jgi:hypothetical protein
VGFEIMETKVGAKTSRDGRAKIGGCGDVCLSTLEQNIELLLTRSSVKIPEKGITHIDKGRVTPGVKYPFWIGTVCNEQECWSNFHQEVVAGGDRETLRMGGDSFNKPVLKLRFDGIHNENKWFIRTTKSLNALLEFGKANVGWPDETKRRRADFREVEMAVCTPGLIIVNGATNELPRWEEDGAHVLKIELRKWRRNEMREPFRGSKHRTVRLLGIEE